MNWPAGILLFLACLVTSLPAQQVGASGGFQGGVMGTGCEDGSSALERSRVASLLSANGAPPNPLLAGGLNPQQGIPFYPLGALFREDCGISNFVDLDTNPGTILDFNCGTVTYDGHDASDALIPTFDEQAIGVPIYAARDGIVIDAHDGETDMNVFASGLPANYVVIDHGDNHLGWYWHMKSGSVAVSIGQAVVQGQEIGRVGSSGNSNWPHLHFAYTQGYAPLEPFAGPCNPGLSLWSQQPPFPRPTSLWDCGISRTNPGTPGAPYSMPRDGQLLLSDPLIYIWFMASDFPANSTWRFIFERPDGSVEYDSGTGNFGNPQWATAQYWFNWNILGMHTTPGTWTVRLHLNGVEVAVMPIDVVAALSPGFNRPPAAITTTLEPAQPDAKDVLRARVTSSRLYDDPDWDLVKHRFVWKVNGTTVRDVTLACRSDMLPRTHFAAGNTVSVTVTADDGTVTGTPVQKSVVISAGYPGSGDDFELRSGIGGAPSLASHVVSVQPGDPLLMLLVSPQGGLIGKAPLLVGQFFVPGSPPVGPPGFAFVHLDLAQPIFVIFDGSNGFPFGPSLLPPGGMPFFFSVPAGFAGTSFMMQAFAFTSAAQNGIFAATNGKEIRFN